MADCDDPIKKQRKHLTRTYLFQNSFVLLVGILFLTTSVSFFFDPHQVGKALGHIPPYDYWWNTFYLVGSAMVIYGLLSQRVAIEAAGHILFVPGLLLNFLLSATVLGLHSATLLTMIFAIGSGLRAYGLFAGWRGP